MENNLIRLNRYLAQCGLGSRRACDRIIAEGKIRIDGKQVTELGTRIDPDVVSVSYCGKTVQEVRAKEYVAYHKSKGSVVTAHDPQGRETIYSALRNRGFSCDHLRYVGRLDRNSEGLLILTNDGRLVHALTHPRFHVKKVYRVRIDKPLAAQHQTQMIEEGVVSQGQQLHAGAIRKIHLQETQNQYWYEIDLYEGKNRQIRRMFETLGYAIIRLKRVQFGVIKLRDLPRGQLRHLSEREVKGLMNLGYR